MYNYWIELTTLRPIPPTSSYLSLGIILAWFCSSFFKTVRGFHPCTCWYHTITYLQDGIYHRLIPLNCFPLLPWFTLCFYHSPTISSVRPFKPYSYFYENLHFYQLKVSKQYIFVNVRCTLFSSVCVMLVTVQLRTVILQLRSKIFVEILHEIC